MSRYAGITIGPIVNTLLLAHSPAAMWYASHMFSSLTEKICSQVENRENIISPYYDGAKYSDGIGRYHDRIIIKDIDSDELKTIIDSGKKYVAQTVVDDLKALEPELKDAAEIKRFVYGYLQIHYVICDVRDDENPIISIGGLLDSLEQMVSPNPDNTCNPFVKLFAGKEFRNDYVREHLKGLTPGSQLLYDGRLRDIPHIASRKREEDRTLKKEFYYAVVEADGDGMGNFIKTLDSSEIRGFSKKCLEYAGEAAEQVGAYGGMTVYAGGDDLLFIAPVSGKDEKNIFELCKDISDKFHKKMAETGKGTTIPTLSFGIAIRREGFPLYEALNHSLTALEKAKNNENGRNEFVIDFQKGSGQAIQMAVPFEKFELFKIAFGLYRNANNDTLKSAIYIFESSRIKMLKLAVKAGRTMTENLVKNTFDNEGQKCKETFITDFSNAICDYFEDKTGRCVLLLETGNKADRSDEYNRIKSFEAILRLSKFMIEKKGVD